MSTPPDRKKTEAKIEAHLVRGVERLGGECLKLEVKGRPGWPDRLCILPHGLTVFVELKTTTGRLSSIQKNKIKKLEGLGHFVEVAYGKKHVDLLLGLMKALILEAEELQHLRTTVRRRVEENMDDT